MTGSDEQRPAPLAEKIALFDEIDEVLIEHEGQHSDSWFYSVRALVGIGQCEVHTFMPAPYDSQCQRCGATRECLNELAPAPESLPVGTDARAEAERRAHEAYPTPPTNVRTQTAEIGAIIGRRAIYTVAFEAGAEWARAEERKARGE